MMITVDFMNKWLNRLADVFEANKVMLTDLDAAIGDADHGINIARGFTAVRAALSAQPPATLSAACKTASMTLIKTVGGASGPLYGTFFMKMGPGLPGADASLGDFANALAEGVEGLKNMGKCHPGEKTMLDAWLPAVTSLKQSARENAGERDAFSKAAAAAQKGMRDTVPMLARKGRASYIGERSVGHQDPGATSTYLMLKTLAEV